MIKINLLRERPSESVGPKAPKVSVEPRPIQSILVLAVLIISAVALGTWYWYATYSELQDKQARRVQMDKEAKRLENIQKEAERFERLTKVIEQRTAIIEQLKENQVGPVRMMNTIIQSLPPQSPQVWLQEVSQKQSGNTESITVKGLAYDVNAIADFYTNLKHKDYFSNIEWIFYDRTRTPVSFEFECRLVKQTSTAPEEKRNAKKK